ncbi:MAG: transglycosylase SLT domain-containing protein [Methylobacillus sp.]|jgi:hypothetical protein|nr:transglycosylase SLT domain-containing protein [Methylobacillus sp.]
MARGIQIPVYDNYQVMPNTLPQARLNLPNFHNYAADQSVEMGRAAEGFGLGIGKIALEEQETMNNARIADATTQLMKLDTDLKVSAGQLKGKAAMDGVDGEYLPDYYVNKINEGAQSIAGTLGNDRQRAAFAEVAARVKSGMYANISAHVANEALTYQNHTYDTQMGVANDRAGKLYNDDAAVEQSANAAETAAIDKYRNNFGEGNKEAEGLVGAAARDNVYATRYQAWAQVDEVAAYASFQKWKEAISPDMREKLDNGLFAQSSPLIASSQVVQSLRKEEATPAVSQGDIEAFVHKQESGGRDYDKKTGKPIKSNKGALFGMQVIPPTAKNPGYGILPAQSKTPEEYNRVGRELLGKLTEKYGGDVSKALAAYNSGTAEKNNYVDRAVEKAGKAEPGTPQADWFWQLNNDERSPQARKETREYVEAGRKELGIQSYGLRPDGSSKGSGFLGELKRADGGISTEISVGVTINGKEMDIPTLVPTLTKQERDWLLNNDVSDPSKIPDSIIQKAVDHAKNRIAEGKSVFAESGVATKASRWPEPSEKTGIDLLDNMSPAQRQKIYQLAETQRVKATDDERAAMNLLVQNANAEAVSTGKVTNMPSREDLRRVYGDTVGDAKYREINNNTALGQKLGNLDTMSVDDIQNVLTSEVPQVGAPDYADQLGNYEKFKSAAGTLLEDRVKDPVKYALRAPKYGIEPFTNWADEAKFSEQLAARGNAVGQYSADFRTRQAVFTQAEAESFGAYLAALQPADQARLLGLVYEKTGAGIASLSAQLKDKDLLLAVAGSLTAQNKTWNGMPTNEGNPAQMYLEGKQAIAEKRVNIKDAEVTGTMAQINRRLLDAYPDPKEREVAAEAAFGIYGKLAADGGGGIDDAVRIATGGIANINGRNTLLPRGMSVSQFKDRIADISGELSRGGNVNSPNYDAPNRTFIVGNTEVKGAQLAKMLSGAKLMAIGDYYYVFSGGAPVVYEDGAPLVLDIGRNVLRWGDPRKWGNNG